MPCHGKKLYIICCDMICRDMTWYEMWWRDMIWCDKTHMIWWDTVQNDVMWFSNRSYRIICVQTYKWCVCVCKCMCIRRHVYVLHICTPWERRSWRESKKKTPETGRARYNAALTLKTGVVSPSKINWVVGPLANRHKYESIGLPCAVRASDVKQNKQKVGWRRNQDTP